MGATFTDSFKDDFVFYSLFTKDDEGPQHPECVLILSQVETFLMKQVHSGVVTVITKKTLSPTLSMRGGCPRYC